MKFRLFLVILILMLSSISLTNTEIQNSQIFNSSESYNSNLLLQNWNPDNTNIENQFTSWKAGLSENILEIADSWLDKDLQIPMHGGNWTHYFTCDNGNKLVFDSNESTEFWCDSEQKWYSGEKYTTAWAALKHREMISNAAIYSAFAYQISANMDYANVTEEILVQYANLYPELNFRNKHNTTLGNVGKLTTQSLDEAVLLIDLAWSYDLIKTNLKGEVKIHIEENLLLDIISTLQRESNLQKSPLSNWYAYHNAGIMMVASTLGNSSLVDLAINGTHGFKFQLANGVLGDGLWHEGSISYHNYTLNSMIFVMEAGRMVGLDLYNTTVFDSTTNSSRTVKDMFLAPLGLVRPDGYIPKLNDDIRGINLHDMLRIYELANMIWDDEVFDWAILRASEIGPRDQWASYFWGQSVSESDSYPISRTYNESGIGVLRTENSFLLLDYGPHGGWHGHFDKLSFEFFALGSEMFIDHGVTVYSLPISSEWFRSTLGHSTILVGNQNQLEATGQLSSFGVFEDGGFLSADVENITDGVNSSRFFMTIDLGFDGVILVDLMNSSSAQLQNYSSTYHGINDIEVISNHSLQEVSTPEQIPWSYLQSMQMIYIENEAKFRWNVSENRSVDLIIPPQPNLETALIANAPNNPPDSTHDLIILNATKELYDFQFSSILHSRTDSSPVITSYQLANVNGLINLELNLSNQRNISIQFDRTNKALNSFIQEFPVEIIEIEYNQSEITSPTSEENTSVIFPSEDNLGEKDHTESVPETTLLRILIAVILILALTSFMQGKGPTGEEKKREVRTQGLTRRT